MAKLGLNVQAGFNAGQNYYSKTVRVQDIVIDPEISKIFSIQDKTLEGIRERMKKCGYDKSQPVVLIKGQNIIVDGHTRLAAAKEAGLEEIPAVEMEFKDHQEAILYTLERQVLRRNLTGEEILTATQIILEKGGSAHEVTKSLGVSRATAYQAIKVLKEGSEDDVQAVKNGEKSIKKAYTTIADSTPSLLLLDKNHERLPNSAGFLKDAVLVLVEALQHQSAKLLINHFLKEDELENFYSLLLAEASEHQTKLLISETTKEQLGFSTGIVYQ